MGCGPVNSRTDQRKSTIMGQAHRRPGVCETWSAPTRSAHSSTPHVPSIPLSPPRCSAAGRRHAPPSPARSSDAGHIRRRHLLTRPGHDLLRQPPNTAVPSGSRAHTATKPSSALYRALPAIVGGLPCRGSPVMFRLPHLRSIRTVAKPPHLLRVSPWQL
jgi:hypothetical protein